jgi:hypothetical protein
VRDELTDEEAQSLLQWAEEQVTRLAAQNLDDEAFDTALSHLKRLMRGMNRFSARLADLTLEDQQALLAKMQASASAVGLEPAAGFSAQAAPPADPYDVAANLRALMASFSTSSPDAPAALAAPDAPQLPDAPDTPDAPEPPDAPDMPSARSPWDSLY